MNIFKIPVHPAADILPMLPDEELDELAADIKTHGLQQPLAVQDGQLIDGRNRREACRRAGIEPRVVDLNGADATAYVLSANINRRHLSKGQRAMAVAKLYPDPEKLKRAGTSKIKEPVNAGAISQARTVLRWLPEVADLVLAGSKALNEAYEDAHRIKESADAEPKRLARLRARAPDLADLVDEGRIRLTEGESTWQTREEDVRRARQATTEIFNGLERLLDTFAPGRRLDDIVRHLSQPADRRRATSLAKQWRDNLSALLEALK